VVKLVREETCLSGGQRVPVERGHREHKDQVKEESGGSDIGVTDEF